MRPAGAEALECSVFRVKLRSECESSLGTAFPVAPGLLLTCAHVVLEREPGDLLLQSDEEGGETVTVEAILPHPDYRHVDAALLRIEPKRKPLKHLAVGGALREGARLAARGFGGEEGHAGARTIYPVTAGRTRAWYNHLKPSGEEVTFEVSVAYVLRDDPSRPGDSGGPILDVAAGIVVGLMIAAPVGTVRSFALPVDRAVDGFPNLAEALAWNEASLPRFAGALNIVGAAALCSAQVTAAIAMLEGKTFLKTKCTVRRRDAERVLTAFLADRTSALPVLAAPGSGKTALLTTWEPVARLPAEG